MSSSCTATWYAIASQMIILWLQVALGAPPTPAIPHSEPIALTYDSGLRVVLDPVDGVGVVSTAMLVGSGAAADPAGAEGTAHLVEHLWFEIPTQAEHSVRSTLDSWACSSNAFTTADYTLFGTACPADVLSELVDIELSRVEESLPDLPDGVFEVEREVIVRESHYRSESIGRAARRVLSAKLYGKAHPYSRLGRATPEVLRQLQPGGAQAFMDLHYRPDNTILVIGGDFDPRTVASMLAERLGTATRGADGWRSSMEFIEPDQAARSPDVAVVSAPIDTTTATFGWRLPPTLASTDPNIELMPALVGALIRYQLRSEERIRDTRCGLSRSKHDMLLVCTIPSSSEDAAQLAKLALKQAKWMWSPVSRTNLARYTIGASLRFTLNTLAVFDDLGVGPDCRGAAIARSVFYSGDPDVFSAAERAMSDVRPRDLGNRASEYLRASRAIVAVLEPASPQVQRYPVAVRDVAPAPVSETEPLRWPAEDVQKVTLGNGLEIVAVRSGLTRYTEIDAIVYGGTAREPYALTAFAESMIGGPPQPFDSRAKVSRSLHSTWVQHTLRGTADDTDMLRNMRKIMSERWVSTASTATVAARGKERALSSWEHPEQWAATTAAQHLDAGHVLSHSLELDDWQVRFSVREMEEYLATHYQPGNVTIVAVGPDPPEEVAAGLGRAFATWKPAGRNPGRVADPPPPGPSKEAAIYVFDDRNTAQSKLGYECALPASQPGDAAKLAVIEAWLDARLHKELRQRTGHSYTQHVSIQTSRGGSTVLRIGANADPHRSAEAISAVRGIVEEAAAGNIDPEELEQEISRLSRRMTVTLQPLPALSNWVTNAIAHGIEAEQLQDFPTELAKVEPKDLQSTLAGCNGSAAITLVGSNPAIVPSLVGAGLEHQVVQWWLEDARTPQ